MQRSALSLVLVTLLALERLSSGGPPACVPEAQIEAARQAKDSFEHGDYREAERIYLRMLADLPDNLYVLSNLGVTRFRQGKLKLAEEAFRRAITVAPDDSFSHGTLGTIYYSQSRYDDALTALTKAIALNPKNAAAHRFLGLVFSQKGRAEAAKKEFEAAEALEPSKSSPDEKPGGGDLLTPREKSRLQLPRGG